MEIDPHTLQQIIRRIEQQMRCPQCGNRVPVDFSSVRLVANNALILQLKCEGCNAFIVLHASMTGVSVAVEDGSQTTNVSSNLSLADNEVAMLHSALEESGGSFEQLFRKYGASEVQHQKP
ncbi:MAG: hypothetical protein V1926_02285 [Candidatus Peregrinibacteria bacterium]